MAAKSCIATSEKLAYGLGDAAANVVFQLQISFLLYFYTDVFGLLAGTAGVILLISRLADALYGIAVGAIADRTRSRWGQYRIWVLGSAVPLAIALVLTFASPGVSANGKILWAAITYNALMISYAAHNIPYSALVGVMTDDANERTSLASWRFMGAMGMALVVNTFTLDLVKWFGAGDDARGFLLTAIAWSAAVLALSVVTFLGTAERVAAATKQRTPLRQDLIDLLRNRSWIVLFLLAVLLYVQLSLRSGTLLFYFKHFVGRERLFGAFNGVGLAVTLVGVMLSEPLSARLGKRRLFGVCLVVTALVMSLFALVPPGWPWLLFALQVPLQLAFGPTIPLMWSMMADVIDLLEWKTGRRSAALAFGSLVFGFKLGAGVGGWLSGASLEYFGYVAGGAIPAAAANGTRWIVSILPAAFLLASAALLWLYPIDETLVTKMEAALRECRMRRDSR